MNFKLWETKLFMLIIHSDISSSVGGGFVEELARVGIGPGLSYPNHKLSDLLSVLEKLKKSKIKLKVFCKPQVSSKIFPCFIFANKQRQIERNKSTKLK